MDVTAITLGGPMSTFVVARPSADEAASYYQRYILQVRGENIAQQLSDQLAETEAVLGSLDEARGSERYAPDKWSVKEVLGHMTDTERIFTYRLLRIARGDSTPLPGFDQDPYVPAARFDQQSLRSLLQGFRSVRQSSIHLVETIPEEAWSRRGEASGYAISARALAYIVVGHVTHHLSVLRDRYGIARSAAGGGSPAPA
jgi:uncharacterized damage-inducible protein DinB